MTLLTLVENAVRHGIDPSEQGGRIDIEARVRDGRCTLRVLDTGIGLTPTGKGLGTGPRLAARATAARLRRHRGSAHHGSGAAGRLRGADVPGAPGTAESVVGIAVTNAPAPTALIAEDEPLLRGALERQLAQTWPELQIVARARNGREATQLFDSLQPDICFLDVHMPGVTGVEAARHIGRRAHLVFVTAFDQYAVQAFTQGALDYLVKPVDAARLAETVARLKDRLRVAEPAPNTDALLGQLAQRLAERMAGNTARRCAGCAPPWHRP